MMLENFYLNEFEESRLEYIIQKQSRPSRMINNYFEKCI